MKSLQLANDIAAISRDNIDFIQATDKNVKVASLSDAAFHYNVPDMEAALKTTEAKPEIATEISRRLFVAEPIATLAGLVAREEVPIGDAQLRENVVSVLKEVAASPDISNMPIREAVAQDSCLLEGMTSNDKEEVVSEISAL